MKRILLICMVLAACLTAIASEQQVTSVSVANRDQVTGRRSDSISGRLRKQTRIFRKTVGGKPVVAADSLTSSDYVLSIERVNDKLNSLRDSVKIGFEIVRIQRRINSMTDDINLIRQNSRGRNSVINIKNLYLYQSFASNLDKENDRFQGKLQVIYDRVYSAKSKLKEIITDSVFRRLCADSSIWKDYDTKLTRVERKWLRTDSTARVNIDTLNALKINLADNCMNVSAILNMMDVRLDRAGKQLFGHEVNNIWQSPGKEDKAKSSSTLLISMLGSEQKAISYYIGQTSGKRAIIIVLGLILYAWLFTKRAMIKSLRASGAEVNFLGISYLKNYAVLSLIVVLLCLMPFFDAYAPSSYIAVEFLLLLVVVSLIFSKRNSSGFMPVWITLVALFIVDALVILLTEPTLMVRLLFLGIQVCIILFTVIFYRKLDRKGNYFKFIRTAVITGIILTVAAILCNMTGRISLSGILSFSGIFAVTQSVVLPVFIDTVAEIILLQLQSIRIKKGFTRPFDISVVTRKIKTPMIIIAVMLWILMLSSNLNIYHGITKWAVELFTNPRTIGSISFKLVSVLWFFVIIWMAHILQQLISFLFGETGMETEEMSPISKKQHSRLLITRLLVLVGGYMLAIAASGLPIDKLTFLLGALGVGIGMGLQNVVNNFVSGIILIFDGSLKIGDEIEVSGQAGKVKKIGLRASTLNTADGAEVIIPNGSILSQNIVNWTFSNDQKRVLIWFSLTGKELDSNVITEVINDTIASIPNVITTKKPVILYNRVTPQSCTITVRFWSGINFADSVKSQAMLALSAAFNERQIGFE